MLVNVEYLDNNGEVVIESNYYDVADVEILRPLQLAKIATDLLDKQIKPIRVEITW